MGRTRTTSSDTTPVIEEATFTFRQSHFYAVLVVMAFAAGLLSGNAIWGKQVAPAPQPQIVAAAPTAVPPPRVYEIETEGYPSIGPEDAPITIVEFSDYQCPFCARWHNNEYERLMQAYPDKIRFVYRNFPLDFHQNAFPAAEAAMCAGDQDMYWPYHDILFENQALVNNQEGTVLGQEIYNQYATELGLDIAAFEDCMASRKYQQFVQDDMAYAVALPRETDGSPAVGATPTFFINGHRLVGAYPMENFVPIIEAELEKSS